MSKELFQEKYKLLNKEQKTAVDSIEGPVMVIAGPGTGKTEVLSLRIANILNTVDIGASGVLCLTFTRSGVISMKKRLQSYIGSEANKVKISTFHSFSKEILDKYFLVLGFTRAPEIIEDREVGFIFSDILDSKDWKHLKPRHDSAKYFSDIRSLISLLKREGYTPEMFQSEISKEIDFIKSDPENISSRGPTKGSLKKDAQGKIESLERTMEVVDFYELYEKEKEMRALVDYDDLLKYALEIVRESDDARSDIREDYQYILVDEHQDSSNIQNEFLQAVWSDTESPNIFVVGDDRQLIYGFGGASLSYFENFKTSFGKAKLITLLENYRSTGTILKLADNLLSSSLAEGSLRSNLKESHDVSLLEYTYPRDEIIAAGLYFQEKIKNGRDPRECALLLPKNHNVKTAIGTLRSMGLPVSGGGNESLFSSSKFRELKTVLSVVSDPNNHVSLSRSVLSSISSIDRMQAFEFLKKFKGKDFSVSDLTGSSKEDGLFAGQNQVALFGEKLKDYIEKSSQKNLVQLISYIGEDLLVKKSNGQGDLYQNVEILRTLIHLGEIRMQKNENETLEEFVDYLSKIESYGMDIPIATLLSSGGISVMTLHRSKGLEFEDVWIAHMDDRSVMSSKKEAFSLPLSIKEKIERKDKDTAKREIYVAITRAKKHCTLSYPRHDIRGGDLELSEVIREIEDGHFVMKSAEETEKEILKAGPDIYIKDNEILEDKNEKEELTSFVKDQYDNINVTVSMLNNFFECPWKWYFRNFLKLPEEKNESLVFGSAVHAGIEEVIKNPKSKNEDIEKVINESIRKEFFKEDKRLSKEALEVVKNWKEKSLPDLSSDRQSERSVSFSDKDFSGLNMYGKLDLTERFSDGSIFVTDFKTGKPKPASQIEKMDDENRLSDYMRQLAMYSYLIEGSEKKEVALSKLYFLEAQDGDKNMIYQKHIGQEELDLLKRDIKDYRDLLESRSWTDRKCNNTGFGRGDCEYCSLAKEIYKKSF
ncbi:ATP-dependent helicase [Candidatus Nomurabacteria bacterium]|nr:ATP-dependent helicase [Candidatus Nomurabacteria bacterium]USN94799.1 MAG: ATP-dependent helicase [Candidatus Nomurabacteria bacterium]